MQALPPPTPKSTQTPQIGQSAQVTHDPTFGYKGVQRMGRAERARKFVDAYLDGASGAEAARVAGWPDSQARSAALKLLNRPEVKARIDRACAASSLRSAQVVAHISAVATFDPSAFGAECYRFDAEQGRRVVNWAYIRAQGLGPMIREVGASGKAGHEVIRWYSRTEALATLAKIMGLTRDRLEVSLVDMRRATDEELERLANG